MVRWYISPFAGIGSPQDPFHAAAFDHIDPERDKCDGPVCHQKRCYVTRIDAPKAVQDAIVANSAGTPITPLYADEAAETDALDKPFTTEALKSAADALGYSTTWMGDTNTARDMLRWFVRHQHLSQRLFKIADRLFAQGLNSTAGDLTLAQRNVVKNWMQDKGLATGWITNSTTVRQIIHFVIMNLGMGKFRVRNLEF